MRFNRNLICKYFKITEPLRILKDPVSSLWGFNVGCYERRPHTNYSRIFRIIYIAYNIYSKCTIQKPNSIILDKIIESAKIIKTININASSSSTMHIKIYPLLVSLTSVEVDIEIEVNLCCWSKLHTICM